MKATQNKQQQQQQQHNRQTERNKEQGLKKLKKNKMLAADAPNTCIVCQGFTPVG